MKVLLVHNFYQQAGGEDAVYNNELSLLRKNNIEVVEYRVDNSEIRGFWGRLCAISGCVFNVAQYLKMLKVIREVQPDVVHVHNFFPIISPSVFYACKRKKVPVVLTLHNYRTICPTSLLMHGGKIVENSVKGSSFWAFKERVYRRSFLGTLALCSMVDFHKKVRTWQNSVDRYLALTEFAKCKYVEAGWPAEKIDVKPNFVPNQCVPTYGPRDYALYVGRLSEEKGIKTILDAWEGVGFPIKIVGDGPLKSLAESCSNDYVEYLGRKSQSEVYELLSGARFIVMASSWYEGFPMVLVEAFSLGVPALVPKLGGMAEVVIPNYVGEHFESGNSNALRKHANFMASNFDICEKYGKNARTLYERSFSPEKNFDKLLSTYKEVIARSAD